MNAILDENGVEGFIMASLQTIGFQQTDYGKALEDFCDNHLARVDRRTTVIILGDARSNFADPRLDLMYLIQQRARAVIWLNPEPESYRGEGDSVMHRYERFTHVARHCNTLGQLERIIEDVLQDVRAALSSAERLTRKLGGDLGVTAAADAVPSQRHDRTNSEQGGEGAPRQDQQA